MKNKMFRRFINKRKTAQATRDILDAFGVSGNINNIKNTLTVYDNMKKNSLEHMRNKKATPEEIRNNYDALKKYDGNGW